MESNLSFERITDDNVVIDYIDDYLYDRLSHDETKSINDWISGGHHISIKNEGRIVGVVSITVDEDYAVIHPKVRKEHMVYAKRCCDIGLDYIKQELNIYTVFAYIPTKFKSNCKMAIACKMDLVKVLSNARSIGGKKYNVNVYGRAL